MGPGASPSRDVPPVPLPEFDFCLRRSHILPFGPPPQFSEDHIDRHGTPLHTYAPAVGREPAPVAALPPEQGPNREKFLSPASIDGIWKPETTKGLPPIGNNPASASSRISVLQNPAGRLRPMSSVNHRAAQSGGPARPPQRDRVTDRRHRLRCAGPPCHKMPAEHVRPLPQPRAVPACSPAGPSPGGFFLSAQKTPCPAPFSRPSRHRMKAGSAPAPRGNVAVQKKSTDLFTQGATMRRPASALRPCLPPPLFPIFSGIRRAASPILGGHHGGFEPEYFRATAKVPILIREAAPEFRQATAPFFFGGGGGGEGPRPAYEISDAEARWRMPARPLKRGKPSGLWPIPGWCCCAVPCPRRRFDPVPQFSVNPRPRQVSANLVTALPRSKPVFSVEPVGGLSGKNPLPPCGRVGAVARPGPGGSARVPREISFCGGSPPPDAPICSLRFMMPPHHPRKGKG